MSLRLRPGPPGPRGPGGVPGPQGPQGAQGDPGIPTTVSDTTTVDLVLVGDDLSANVLPGGIDHGALADLAADDHAQYLLLAGRTGGQTIKPGLANGDPLVIDLTQHQSDQLQIDMANVASNPGTTAAAIGVLVGQTISLGAAGSYLKVLGVFGDITVNANPNTIPMNVFAFQPTITLQSAGFRLRGPKIFTVAPVIRLTDGVAHGAVSQTTTPFAGMWDFTRYLASIPLGTGTGTSERHWSAYSNITVDTGWTLNEFSGHRVEAPLGAGVVGEINAFDVDDLAARAGLNVAFRSRGAGDQSRLAGSLIVGADAAPDANAALELRTTTKGLLNARLTNAQAAALAAAGVLDGTQIYVTDAGALAIGMHQRLGGAWVAM